MSILEAILTGKTTGPRITTIYGVPGIGKSTWASGAPSPIFIPTEQGLEDIGVARFPLCTSWACVDERLTALYSEKHDYKTLVVDSLSALEPLIWKATCAEKGGKGNIEDFGYGKGYVLALDLWRKFTTALDCLRNDKGMNVVLIGHSKVTRFNDPEGDAYDQFDIDIHKLAASAIFRWSDEVLFANYEVFKATTGEGLKKRTIGVGSAERKIYTSERPGRKAKNRLGMPDVINFSWSAYAEHLGKPQPSANRDEVGRAARAAINAASAASK